MYHSTFVSSVQETKTLVIRLVMPCPACYPCLLLLVQHPLQQVLHFGFLYIISTHSMPDGWHESAVKAFIVLDCKVLVHANN